MRDNFYLNTSMWLHGIKITYSTITNLRDGRRTIHLEKLFKIKNVIINDRTWPT